MKERTLAIIKPDGVSQRLIGEVIRRLEASDFRILNLKMVRLSRQEAEGFYAIHRERPFFQSLTAFMCEGPIVVLLLEAEEAIQRLRTLMGATDPAKADTGTIRRDFGSSVERNVIHGSDSSASAQFEISFFFDESKNSR
ncbi:MAG: nucleoside-diphosphate kinase [Acidobacteria bacterium]|nr:nucleoside-diphosphate kinase [Acidobacteriota bacterium]